jgi:bacillithiol system protein YtxJ
MQLNWISIGSADEVEQIKQQSFQVPCLILKHSTSCNISAIAKFRLEDDWAFSENTLKAYYLDLLRFRSVSAYLAETFEVHHESPQILIISNGECIFDASHLDITVDEIKEVMASVTPA